MKFQRYKNKINFNIKIIMISENICKIKIYELTRILKSHLTIKIPLSNNFQRKKNHLNLFLNIQINKWFNLEKILLS